MTATGNPSHRTSRPNRRGPAVTAVAGGLVAVLGVAAIASSGGGAAGAATTYTVHASGRFLSGTIGGQNLDVVAGIEGVSAKNPHGGPRVVNRNSLNAEALNGAINIPLQDGLHRPGQHILHLGAVGQYAEANPSGKAIGAAGAVDSNGGIGLGGKNDVPPANGTLNLAGLGGGALSALLNIKATIGATSAQAHQAAGRHGAQTGKYLIDGLLFEVDLPKLADLLGPVLDTVGPLLDTLSTQINNLGALLPPGTVSISIPSLSDLLDSLTTLSLDNGGVVVDLQNGKIVVDVAKILKALGLDLNNLPPNTSIVPYIIDALTNAVPQAISDLVDSLVDTITTQIIDEIKVTVGGVDVTGNSNVAGLITTLTGTLGSTLSTVLGALHDLSDQLGPVFDLLSKIIEIVVNAQSRSNGVFTEQAVLLTIGSGTGFTLPPLGPPVSSSRAKIHAAQAQIRAKARQEKADAKANGSPTSAPSGGESPDGAQHTRLTGARHAQLVHIVRPAAAPVDAVVSLALATATVGPSSPFAPPSTPTPTTSVPSTNVPTGVPAGSGTHGEGITLPLVLVLLGLVLAGGGAYAYRGRGKFGA